MRRSVLFTLVCSVVAVACNNEEVLVITPNPNSYQITAPLTDVRIGQDSLISLHALGLRVVRNGTDTIPGPNTSTQPLPRLSYFVDDVAIAYIDFNANGQFGFIRGTKPGVTNVRAVGYGVEITFPVTVTAHTPTEVILRVLNGPTGTLIPAASRTDTGTFYALPSDNDTARLEGLILKGTDTLYCNYCAVKNPGRVQRIVNFRVVDPLKATVSNADDPTRQRASQGGNLDDTDEAGWVTILDTTSTPFEVIMDVPGDGLADTVRLKFALRPIDTLRIMPDSLDIPATDVDDLGTERVAYEGDEFVGIAIQSGNTNFIARVEFQSFVTRVPVYPSTTAPAPTTITTRPTGGVNNFRPFVPIVTWESALDTYLEINAAGAVVAPCASVDGAVCLAPTVRPSGGGLSAAARAQQARDSLVMKCVDNGRRLPGTLTNGEPMGLPIAFDGDGILSFATCPEIAGVPGPNITMPGAYCTSANLADLSSTCSIWIRATATDQATGKMLRDRYRIEVRRQ